MTTLPNFLVVGGHRCGTTWLYQRLVEHPEVYVPLNRKEIEFFDKNYNRGINWYENYFVDANQMSGVIAVGEVTPGYSDDDENLLRISRDLGKIKIILLVREPIDRIISHYKYWVKNYAEKKSFIEFANQPHIINKSMYSHKIEMIEKLFGSENCLVMSYEELMRDKQGGLEKIAIFLGLDALKWNMQNVDEIVNSSEKTRFHLLYVFLRYLGQGLRKLNLDKTIERVKRSPFMTIFYNSEGEKASDMLIDNDKKELEKLKEVFSEDIAKVEHLLGRKIWQNEFEHHALS